MGALLSAKPGGNLILAAFKEELQKWKNGGWTRAQLGELVTRTRVLQERLEILEKKGRNRLLEWGSNNPEGVAEVIKEIRNMEEDPVLWELVYRLFVALGVEVERHTLREWVVRPGPLLHPGFPWLKGTTRAISFSRTQAMKKETTLFLSPDHPMVGDAMELWLASHRGSTSCVAGRGAQQEIRLKATHILEAIAPPDLWVERFLPPTPVTVTVNQREELIPDGGPEIPLQDLSPQVFEEGPQLMNELLSPLLGAAKRHTAPHLQRIREQALAAAQEHYESELQRLEHLLKVNPVVSPQELQDLTAAREKTINALAAARPRLDTLQLQLIKAF
ncbi:MAG: hypothetical protein CSA75_04240 [Sorangium cellulosum]|nr:MAG: hypothetical protein CSA75_04240 [Sorangium cellulosum]